MTVDPSGPATIHAPFPGTRRLTAAVILLVAVAAGGCVSLRDVVDHGWDGAAAIQRGQEVAARDCKTCHADGPGPAFTNIAHKYTQPALERELETIDRVGHYGMQPRPISPTDVRDLAAYIASLADE